MLKVSVISPESVLFDGEVASVVAPAFDGEVGILQNHAPMNCASRIRDDDASGSTAG